MTVGIILLMAVVSGLIRYVHDSRSSHAATALATMVSTTATVRRVGAGERQIPSEELVVGDIVTLSAGDIVPADCKLLESRDLRIAQGALTGESMPVRKDAAALLAAGARDTALTDAACLVFMGTTVISGSALAVVIATGRSALFGGLSRAFQWQRPPCRWPGWPALMGRYGPARPTGAKGPSPDDAAAGGVLRTHEDGIRPSRASGGAYPRRDARPGRRLHPPARPQAHQTVARLDEPGTIPSKPRNGYVITSKKNVRNPPEHDWTRWPPHKCGIRATI